MLQTVLNPLRVFVFVGEIPSGYTLIGGTIILLTIADQSFFCHHTYEHSTRQRCLEEKIKQIFKLFFLTKPLQHYGN
jgi:predicted nuclease of restriction endonuclease-like (RecB) superfamily